MSKVKVRIAVAVDPKGGWNSFGWKDPTMDKGVAEDIAFDGCLPEGAVVYWVEADLDIPSAPVVQGTVTPA